MTATASSATTEPVDPPWPDPRSLQARTVVLARRGVPEGRFGLHPRHLDPVVLATSTGEGFLFATRNSFVATSGVAATITLPGGLGGEDTPAVTRWLSDIPGDDPLRRPGSGPIAVSALPFLPGRHATLIVPAIAVTATAEDDCWITMVGPPSGQPPSDQRPLGNRHQPGNGQEPALRFAGNGDDPLPGDIRALLAQADGQALIPREPVPRRLGSSEPVPTKSIPAVASVLLEPGERVFEEQVAAALRSIDAADVSKVVLARRVVVQFEEPVDVPAVLHRLQELEPNTTVFAWRHGHRSFLGASPELLVERIGSRVRSHPLAGTRPLDPDDRPESVFADLVASAKDRAEHEAVVSAVVLALAPWCTSVDAASEPQMVQLRSVVHLGTPITGRLGLGPRRDALSLAGALHPTPAVAGVPTGNALRIIAALEGDRRGCYAGPVGWVDSRGDGTYVVGIRSASIDENQAVLDAGVGIVAGSVPSHELAETTAKLGSTLHALGVTASTTPVRRTAGSNT